METKNHNISEKDLEQLKLYYSAEEIAKIENEGNLKSMLPWSAKGGFVAAAVVGGASTVIVNYGGKKMEWNGIIAGLGIGGTGSLMVGFMYVSPSELLKCKWVYLRVAAVLGGSSAIEFLDGKNGKIVGSLRGVAIGLGGGYFGGNGAWKYV